MKYNSYTPYKGGTLTVAMPSAQSIPDAVTFEFADRTITVDFWLVQLVRQSIELIYPDYSDDSNSSGKEDKIQFIKCIRRIYSLGLKESKDIAEWFWDNVERSVTVKV